MKRIKRGKFIVLEGIDGSGTTSQSHAVATILRQRGSCVLRTWEPSSGSIGVRTRSALSTNGSKLDPRALALLFAADRIDHIESVIKPWLEHLNSYVICDRYVWSALAYQTLDCDAEWVMSINKHAIVPDLTILLRVPVDEARRRVEARAALESTPSEIFDAHALQERVAGKYEQIFEGTNGAPVGLIDGIQPKEVVTEKIVRLIDDLEP